MKQMSHWLLRLFLTSITGTSQNQRLIIFGVRRSGNHALTNWLCNAVGETNTSLISQGDKPPHSHCFVSNNRKVVHFNELNELGLRETFRLFLKARSFTKNCDKLLVSFEDVRPSSYSNFRRLRGTEIHIQRKALEIISSRFHNINKKANSGIGWSRQSCDHYFFETLKEYLSPINPSNINWHYNKWLSDPLYRREFLDKIKLHYDEIPQHSGVGGGSSFHGTSGSLENNLSQRLMKVQPQKPWKGFLTNVLDDYPEIFTSDEVSVAHQFLRKQ